MKHRASFGALLDQESKPVPKDEPDPYVEAPSRLLKTDNIRHLYWGSEIEAEPPSVQYDDIMADDTGVGLWTEKIVWDCSSRNVTC